MSDTLRPGSWPEYVGQTKLKHELAVRIAAAKVSQRPLDPMLLVGPPGAGKTSLAQIIATEMGQHLEVLIMPVTFRTIANLVKQQEDIIVLLDELHGLAPKAQGELLPLMEFGFLQESNGRKIQADGLSIIGATTEPQRIIKPLYDRFVVPPFDPYTDDEMAEIVTNMARKAGITDLPEDVAMLFGVASCGTPRRARQFVLAYDALSKANNRPPTGDDVMDLLRTTHDGLTTKHIEYLTILNAMGGTRGLKPIAALMQLSESVVQDLERLLFLKGLVLYGDRGRELSAAGFARVRKAAA